MRYFAAMRALIGMDQSAVATACQLSPLTVANAESSKRCTDKTRAALMAYYARHGVTLAPLPGDRVAIVWAGDAPSYAAALECIAPPSPARKKRGSYPSRGK